MALANAGISGTTRYTNCYTKLKMKIIELFTIWHAMAEPCDDQPKEATPPNGYTAASAAR